MRARLVLVAGASGSGKSRLTRRTDCLAFRLDDFYRDADAPDLPHTLGIIDWDDAATWDVSAATAALARLLEAGSVEVPAYSIAESRAVGTHTIHLAGCTTVLAEGIFAIELLPALQAAGMPVEGFYLDRSRWLVFWLRLRRDLAGHRKPPWVLVRRGLALWQAQPGLKRRALAAGFRPVSMRGAVRELGGAEIPAGSHRR